MGNRGAQPWTKNVLTYLCKRKDVTALKLSVSGTENTTQFILELCGQVATGTNPPRTLGQGVGESKTTGNVSVREQFSKTTSFN